MIRLRAVFRHEKGKPEAITRTGVLYEEIPDAVKFFLKQGAIGIEIDCDAEEE